MNGLLLLLIMNTLVFLRWRGQRHLASWSESTQSFLRCLESRQYLSPERDADPLAAVFREQLRSGRLQPQALRTLLTWIHSLERSDGERLRVGYGAALRLGLAAGLGLASSLVLDGSWLLRMADNPPALLLVGGNLLILMIWLRRLPAHPLASSLSLQVNFTRAWLGASQAGPWHEAWGKEQEDARLRGRDPRAEQHRLLEDWLLAESREQEKRLTWADELFGLVELASSVYFLGTACTLPLLKLWGG
jgi:hypothetical protein